MFGWLSAAAARASCSNRASRGVRGECRRQYLYRNIAPQARVTRAMDFAHPVGAEQADDLKGGNAPAWRQAHGTGTLYE
jgi:hypothetical protein